MKDFFSEKFEKAPSSFPAAPEREAREAATREALIENFRFVAGRLNDAARESGVRYAMVGGAALSAYCDAEWKPVRDNGSARDIDVVVLNDPGDAVSRIENDIQAARAEGSFFLPVDFNRSKPEGYHSSIQLLAHFKEDKAGHALVFRDVEKHLSEELLRMRAVDLRTESGTVLFDTFEPGTFSHHTMKSD